MYCAPCCSGALTSFCQALNDAYFPRLPEWIASVTDTPQLPSPLSRVAMQARYICAANAVATTLEWWYVCGPTFNCEYVCVPGLTSGGGGGFTLDFVAGSAACPAMPHSELTNRCIFQVRWTAARKKSRSSGGCSPYRRRVVRACQLHVDIHSCKPRLWLSGSLSLSLSGSLAQLQLSWGCVSSTYPVELLHPCGLGSYVIALQGGMWGPEKLPYPPLKLVQISPHIAPLPL